MSEKLPTAKGKKRALLVEGGGMKGAFSGGALHALHSFRWAGEYDLILAVSSGACSAAYYATTGKEHTPELERNIQIWREDLTGWKMISPLNPLFGRPFLNQEYLIDYLFGEKYPINREDLNKKRTTPFYVAVTSMERHRVEFIRATAENLTDLLKAATSLPVATFGQHTLNGEQYSDAAILNPLPVEDVIKAGYKDITVVLNSPIENLSPPVPRWLSSLAFPGHAMADLMHTHHHQGYNRGRELLMHPPRSVKFTIAAPDEGLEVGLTGTRPSLLNDAVDLGYLKGLDVFQQFEKRLRGSRFASGKSRASGGRAVRSKSGTKS
ncbi:MAG: patatin-like phospholipase family protein [Leptospiraceae bacterium]|nr:patatin-like phospholipase family protein [Leptospiraceae bacterium]